MIKGRHVLWAMLGVVVIALGLFIFTSECAYGGAMAGEYKDCKCMGYELELFDQTPADGPRKTICFGLITETTCYEFRDGPEKTCGEKTA